MLDKPIIGSCVAQGFINGCCTTSCAVSNGSSTCYCDQACHNLGDCCSDIEEAGCFSSSITSSNSIASSTMTSSPITLPTPGMHGVHNYKRICNAHTLPSDSVNPSFSISFTIGHVMNPICTFVSLSL